MKRSQQKNIKLIKSIIQILGKLTNRITTINPDSIIFNKELKIAKIKNTTQILTIDNLKISINQLVIRLNLIQQLLLLVSKLKMNFQELQIILTLQTLVQVTNKKKGIFHQEFKHPQLISSTFCQIQKASHNYTLIMIIRVKKIWL